MPRPQRAAPPAPAAPPRPKDACLTFHGATAAALAHEDDLCQQACDGGDMPACEHLAANVALGLGRPRDARRASQLYRQACVSGRAPKACRELGILLDGGSQIPRDHPAALAVWNEGCVQGDQPSCAYARKAQARGR